MSDPYYRTRAWRELREAVTGDRLSPVTESHPYEALHPETKNETFHGNQHKAGVRQLGEDQPADRFTADTAAKTGQSERAGAGSYPWGERAGH